MPITRSQRRHVLVPQALRYLVMLAPAGVVLLLSELNLLSLTAISLETARRRRSRQRGVTAISTVALFAATSFGGFARQPSSA